MKISALRIWKPLITTRKYMIPYICFLYIVNPDDVSSLQNCRSKRAEASVEPLGGLCFPVQETFENKPYKGFPGNTY